MKKRIILLMSILLLAGCSKTVEKKTHLEIKPIQSTEELKTLADDEWIILSDTYVTENWNDLPPQLYDHVFYVADVSLKDLQDLEGMQITEGILPDETKQFDLVGLYWKEDGIYVQQFLDVENCDESYVKAQLKNIPVSASTITLMQDQHTLSVSAMVFSQSTEQQGDILRYVEVQIQTDAKIENGKVVFDNRSPNQEEAYGQLRTGGPTILNEATIETLYQKDAQTIERRAKDLSFPVTLDYGRENVIEEEETGVIPDDYPCVEYVELQYHDAAQISESVSLLNEVRKGSKPTKMLIQFNGFKAQENTWDDFTAQLTLFDE
mgnify:FL=1